MPWAHDTPFVLFEKFYAIIINSFWDTAWHVKKNSILSRIKFWIITKKYTDLWINIIKKCVKFKAIIRKRFWDTARHVKNSHPCFSYKSCNSKSLNPIFTKKYTDLLTIIRNNNVKFHEILISGSQVTVRHVDAGQTDICTPFWRAYKNHDMDNALIGLFIFHLCYLSYDWFSMLKPVVVSDLKVGLMTETHCNII